MKSRFDCKEGEGEIEATDAAAVLEKVRNIVRHAEDARDAMLELGDLLGIDLSAR